MAYVPEQGDLVWLEFNPQKGHEQAGRRPALTLSRKIYNEKTRLGLFCPLTSRVKGYPFEVAVNGKTVSGVVLSDQVKSLDWYSRKSTFIEKADAQVVSAVLDRIDAILGRP